MKKVLLFLSSIVLGGAEPVVAILEWQPACDGSAIERVTEDGEIRSVRASAVHSSTVIEWTIHYLDGEPATAEFRELSRGRIEKGEKAGEHSGENRLKRLLTFRSDKGRFSIADKALDAELKEVLHRAGEKGGASGR